eukprot:sb/3478512/
MESSLYRSSNVSSCVCFQQFISNTVITQHCYHTITKSDPDLPGPDLPEPRFTGRKTFPQFRKLTVYHPDIPGSSIYRAKLFPPSIPVNRGPTVHMIVLIT